MAMKLTEELMKESFLPHLGDGETLITTTYAIKQNWFITYLSKYYFLGLTNKRLLIMQVSMFFKEKNIKKVESQEISLVTIKETILGKTIKIKTNNGEVFKGRVNNTVIGLKNNRERVDTLLGYLRQLPAYIE